MNFRQHSEVAGSHAFLSASNYHWLNYDEEKLVATYDKRMTAALGTRLHAFAKEAIDLGQELPNNSKTLNMYVNDCIGYRMKTEVVLFYSYNAFGTADACDFIEHVEETGRPLLRVFDLKNGETPTKETQLEVYAAFFCLEYKVSPFAIDYDLRIYQHDDIYYFDVDPERIDYIMRRVVEYDKIISSMQKGV